MPKTVLESIESIDMNRIIEHVKNVKMVLIAFSPLKIDLSRNYIKCIITFQPIFNS